MDTVTPIFRQTTWQIIGKLATSVSTFIILGIISRNFHEAGIGIFTLALTYLNIFNLLGDFGFNGHVLRVVSNEGSKITTEWNKLLGTRILWTTFLVLVAIALLPFWSFATKDFSIAIIIGSLAIIASGVFVTCNLIFQSKLRYDLSVIASILGTVVSLGLYVYLGVSKYPVPYLLLAYSLGWVVIAVVALFLVKKIIKVVPDFDFSYIKNLFKNSWPIALTLALNVVYFRVDSFMIAFYKNISDVGVYNIAYSVFQSALVIPTFIMNAYYPIMLKSFSKVKIVGLGLLVLSAMSTVLTLFLSPKIIEILTGGSFVGSVKSLQILSLGFPAYFLSALLMWYLIAKGRYKQTLVIYFFGLLINVCLNLILIPQYSIYGASWTTVVSEYLILLLQFVVLSRK